MVPKNVIEDISDKIGSRVPRGSPRSMERYYGRNVFSSYLEALAVRFDQQ